MPSAADYLAQLLDMVGAQLTALKEENARLQAQIAELETFTADNGKHVKVKV